MSFLQKPRVIAAVSLLLALLMAAAGTAKLLRIDLEVDAFLKFQIPTWLMIQVGLAEIVAALLLLRQQTAALGAIIGVAIMTVAIPAHVFAEEYAQAAMPLLVLGAFVHVGWSRREHLAAFLSP